MDLWSRLLRCFPVLQFAPTDVRERLIALPLLQWPAGTVLFDEGAACSGFPLLLSGCIRVQKCAANGRVLHLYRVLPGESCVLTQGCLLGRQRYNARGSAETDIELLALPAGLFDELLQRSPEFREFVFALFGERLTDLMTLVDEIAFKRLDQRLARLLLERGPQLHLTHQALADELGSVREILTRLLRQFVEEGLVELARESIRVVDVQGLAARVG